MLRLSAFFSWHPPNYMSCFKPPFFSRRKATPTLPWFTAFFWLGLVFGLHSGTSWAQEHSDDYASYDDGYPKQEYLDVLHYRFELSLRDDTDVIEGRGTIRVGVLGDEAERFRFDLVRGHALDHESGMRITAVRVGGVDVPFTHEGDAVHVRLDRVYRSGEWFEVVVSYRGIPETGLKIGPTKYGDRSFFSDNWSSRARHWLPTVDHPYDKATSEMIVTAPSHYQVISNGLRVEETDLGDGFRLTHWKNGLPIATWLNVLGVAQFAVQQVGTFEGKAIETWVYRQDREAGFYDFAVPTYASLAYYSDLVGPYVYEKLANIQSNSVGGGMEAASAIFYDDDAVTGNRDKRWQHVIIHEVAHHWFGNAVTERTWNDLWLSEGFATYYTLRFREHAYGYDDFVAGLRQARDRVIRFYEDDYHFRVIRPQLPGLNDVSGSMIYQKGAWILYMLERRVGREVFDEAVRNYYRAFLHDNATTADFRSHVEAVHGDDLSAYFDEWLYQGGIPQLEGSWLYQPERDRIQLRLSQVQPDYTFGLFVEVAVLYEDGSRQLETISLSGDRPVEMSLRVTGKVVDVVLDPDTHLLASWVWTRR